MTGDTFTWFMTTLLEAYSDKDHSLVIRDDQGRVLGPSPWAKMERQCLEHIPDEHAKELARHIKMTIKTYGNVVPQTKEILDAYADLVHGQDDADLQWGNICAGAWDEVNDEARWIFYDLGGQWSLDNSNSAERASMRRSFLDTYRARVNRSKGETRLGHDPVKPQIEYQPPAEVLRLTERIKGAD